MNSAFYQSTDYLFARPGSDDGKRVATLIPDSAERYLSKKIFEGGV